MKQATKATVKRLQAAAEGREYWSIPATLLRAIDQATEDARAYAECQQYDAMDEYNTYWGYNSGRAYYSAEGLVYRPTRGCQDEYNAHGLAYRYPELVRYLCTHDLNMVIISDINKLAKAILAAEKAAYPAQRGKNEGRKNNDHIHREARHYHQDRIHRV